MSPVDVLKWNATVTADCLINTWITCCLQTLWGLPLLSRIYGSALPRALAPALVAGFITLGLTFVSNEVSSLWLHPYAYNAFVLLVSFVLTFR